MAADAKSIRNQFPFGIYPQDSLAIAQDDAEWSVPYQGDPLLNVVVRCEVLDHWGDHKLAKSCLGKEAPWHAVEAHLTDERGRLAEENWNLWVWAGLGHVTVAYRDEDYAAAEGAVAVVRQSIDDRLSLVPELRRRDKLFLGTRARLAFLAGQVARQQHRDEEARRALGQAIEFATRRFVARTPREEMRTVIDGPPSDPSPEFQQRRLLADWTIGKALALGLGWISLTTGSLSEARSLVSAGYALLRGTNDGLHRAFAMLLLGAVERAESRDEASLEAAITKLEDGANGLRRHPTYSLRASYELALARYKSDDKEQQDLARDEIENVLLALQPKVTPHGLRSKRWFSAALVLKSRMERRRGSSDSLAEARSLAEKAYLTLTGTPHHELRAEARIALGEVLLAQADKPLSERAELLGEAARFFREAAALGENNPKVRAVAQLHLATAYWRQDARQKAVAAFGEWEQNGLKTVVEHGHVQSLAADVGAELNVDEQFTRDDGGLEDRWAEHVTALKAFLIRRATAKGWSDEKIAAHLNIEKSSLRKLKSRLATDSLDAARRKIGRPRG